MLLTYAFGKKYPHLAGNSVNIKFPPKLERNGFKHLSINYEFIHVPTSNALVKKGEIFHRNATWQRSRMFSLGVAVWCFVLSQ